MDLVLKEWWTDAAGRTNDKGVYQTRGFKGEYEIVVKHDAFEKKTALTLGGDGKAIRVVLEE
jgi:endo-1,4-beta-xylanase